MAPCTTEEDCDAAFRMICKSGHCVCKTGDIFFEWPKYGCFSKAHMFGPCEVSGQCMAMNPNTYCNPDNSRCTCSPTYFFNGRECTLRYDGSNLKAQEVYKAAVVAAACFIVAVVGIFVACIVRRSFCRREPNLQQSETSRNSDIFSISDEIAALRAVDKPPSYEEVLQIERTFYGIPPPEYTGPRNPTYQAPSSFSSEPANYLSMPYTSECTPSVPIAESQNLQNMVSAQNKESNATLTENFTAAATTSSHFLAAAEVLTAPQEIPVIVESSPSRTFIQGLSQGIHRPISSTPPPSLRREHIIKPVSLSSSLPGSPLLSSHSGGLILNLPSILSKELLKPDCQTSEPSTVVSVSNIDNPSGPSSSTRNTDGCDSNESPVLAYDNLGFVSE